MPIQREPGRTEYGLACAEGTGSDLNGGAEWRLIFRRAERWLLDATATTGGEPDGRDQLIHEIEYIPAGEKVQLKSWMRRIRILRRSCGFTCWCCGPLAVEEEQSPSPRYLLRRE